MKKIIIMLLAIAATVTSVMGTEYGHIVRRDIEPNMPPNGRYPGGSTFTSLNGRFRLAMQTDGYLVLSEITAYGPIKRWQYPDNGKGTPGEYLILYTCYDGDCTSDKYTLQIGDFAAGKQIVYAQPGRAGWLDVRDDGNLYLYKEGGAIGWISHTTDAEVYGKANYHACVSQGRNLYFPRPFKDEFHTVFFASAVISMRDQCKISQAAAPVTFSALQYVELLPGFETAVTGTGVVILQPAPLTNAPAPARRLTQPAETPPPSGFSIYPNPASSEIRITVDPDDVLKLCFLFDNNGKLVGSYSNMSAINIKNLPAGMYLYKVQTEKNNYSGKIIKE